MSDPVLEFSRDEIIAMLEEGANKRLGMSASQLLLAYRQGRLQEPGDVADLIVLAQLLDEDDPLFAADPLITAAAEDYEQRVAENCPYENARDADEVIEEARRRYD